MSLHDDNDFNSVTLILKDAFRIAETPQILTNQPSLEHSMDFEMEKTQYNNGVNRV